MSSRVFCRKVFLLVAVTALAVVTSFRTQRWVLGEEAQQGQPCTLGPIDYSVVHRNCAPPECPQVWSAHDHNYALKATVSIEVIEGEQRGVTKPTDYDKKDFPAFTLAYGKKRCHLLEVGWWDNGGTWQPFGQPTEWCCVGNHEASYIASHDVEVDCDDPCPELF